MLLPRGPTMPTTFPRPGFPTIPEGNRYATITTVFRTASHTSGRPGRPTCCSLQNREFNAGIWNELEVQVRRWCRRYGPLCVITGGILEPGLPAIGEEEVAVPSRFFKVVIREGADGIRVLAFLMENRPANGPLQGFLVTLDQLEELSGIDFFPGLPQQAQRELEATVQAEGWTF